MPDEPDDDLERELEDEGRSAMVRSGSRLRRRQLCFIAGERSGFRVVGRWEVVRTTGQGGLGVPPLAGRVPAPPVVQTLLADLHHLPGQRPALLRVVQIADDPECSVRRLADAAALDPAFAARLLQLANSAYYGRAGRVSAIGSAAAVLGVETVRGLAVTMALGLSGEHGPLPPGFWERAATTAAATRLAAPRVGADPGDAFCVGLLCEVGQALLFRAGPEVYCELLASCDEDDLPAAERGWCGATNGEVGAAALRAAGLPEPVCRAIERYERAPYGNDGSRQPDRLTRALRAGIVLRRAVTTGEVDDTTTLALVDILGTGLDTSSVRELALRTAAQAAALRSAMG